LNITEDSIVMYTLINVTYKTIRVIKVLDCI